MNKIYNNFFYILIIIVIIIGIFIMSSIIITFGISLFNLLGFFIFFN